MSIWMGLLKRKFTLMHLAALSCALFLSAGGSALAQQPDQDEALSGFDEPSPGGREDARQAPGDAPVPATPSEDAGPSRSSWDIRGSLGLGASYNYRTHTSLDSGRTDYHGLSRLRSELELILDARPVPRLDLYVSGRGFADSAYVLNGRDQYTSDVLDRYAAEVELKDTWVRAKVLPSLDLKIGRQIVVWGKSDNLRVTDVLNPLDNREPGLVDIEDLRLPLVMSRVDWYAGRWNITGIAIHEVRFNKNPVYGSDFFPSPAPSPVESFPSSGGGNTEYAAAVNGLLTGWDVSFYFARIFDDAAAFRELSAGPPPRYVLAHDRLSMAGAAVNVARGNWLLKTEGAYFSDLRYAAFPGRTFDRSDILGGLEYSGFGESTISFEAVNRHVHHYDEALAFSPDAARQDQVQHAFRYQQDFLHQRLHLTLLALTLGWNGRDGKVQRLSLEYEVTDDLALTAGVANYGSGRAALYRSIGRNDRIFTELKYSF